MKISHFIFWAIFASLLAMTLEKALLDTLNERILKKGAYLEERLSEETLYFGDSVRVDEALIAQGWTYTEHPDEKKTWAASGYKHPIQCKTYPLFIYKYSTCINAADRDKDNKIEIYSYQCKPFLARLSLWRVFGVTDGDYYENEPFLRKFRCAEIESSGLWTVYSRVPNKKIMKQGRTQNVVNY